MYQPGHVLEARQKLLQFYRAGLQAVGGEQAVSRYLCEHPQPGNWVVVAIGKAAAAMAMGAQKALGERLYSGLVITKYGHTDPRLDLSRFEVLESGHPVPDEASLRAGEILLARLDKLPDQIPVLFLLSGGASSLVEVLPENMGLSDLERTNEWLLGSGLNIGQMNAIRKRLSCIKGGSLAVHFKQRRCLQLVISDVPGDNLATIGSAPLYPAPEAPLTGQLPPWLHTLLRESEPPPAENDPVFENIETRLVASSDMARQAVANAARHAGLTVRDHSHHFQGLAEELAAAFSRELLEGEPGIYLWGGESQVKLPTSPGMGGRNQHLALAAAKVLAGHDDIVFLAAGTDGSDGPSEEAGALVDGGTQARGELEGFSLAGSLMHADSGSFLEASGDLIETGPTGTNVMDLVIGWKMDVG